MGWIEYLADRPLADRLAPYFDFREQLVANVIQVFEVYRVIRRQFSEANAIEAVAALRTATVVELDESLALEAASVSFETQLAMADALIYTTARRYDAELITMDTHFSGLPQVTLIT